MRFHTIGKISFCGHTMTLDVDSRRVEIDLRKVSPLLAAASPEQRQSYEISPSSYGLHWPGLDEDLSVESLLGIRHAPKTTFAESVAEDGPPVEQFGSGRTLTFHAELLPKHFPPAHESWAQGET